MKLVTLAFCARPPIVGLYWAAIGPDTAGDPCTGLGSTEADALADLIDLLSADATPSTAPALSEALERLDQLNPAMAAERIAWWQESAA